MRSPTPTPRNRRARDVLALLGALVIGSGLLACAGESARDEYYYVRGVRVAPTSVSLADQDVSVPTVAQTDFRTQRWAEATRPGSLSDADEGPR